MLKGIMTGILFSAAAASAQAQDIVNVWGHQWTEINRHGVCREVHNDGGTGIAVPVRRPQEWSSGGNSFIHNTHNMPSVWIKGCTPPEIVMRRAPVQWLSERPAGFDPGRWEWFFFAPEHPNPSAGWAQQSFRNGRPPCASWWLEIYGKRVSNYQEFINNAWRNGWDIRDLRYVAVMPRGANECYVENTTYTASGRIDQLIMAWYRR